jgi:hypothetical protein
MALRKQRLAKVPADQAGAAGNENMHMRST